MTPVPAAVTVLWDPVHRRYLVQLGERFALLRPVAWVDGRPVEFVRTSQYQPAKAEA